MNLSEFSDFHVHSTLSDGADEPEEIIERAIDMEIERLGFSEHSYAPHFPEHTLDVEMQKKYIARISALKEKYKGRIELFCGIELECCRPTVADGFDYVIGSTHYFPFDSDICIVDHTPELIFDFAARHFGGDTLRVAEEYFRAAAEVYNKTKCDIIGHFDLVSKFNEKYHLFDTRSDRYRAAWRSAADELLKCGVPFEINTGAISRGYTTAPYPAPEICRYLAENGARFVLSSDSHSKDTLRFAFDEWSEKYVALGANIVPFEPKPKK